MELIVPMVVRAFGAHHALVVSANNIGVQFIAIDAGGLAVRRLSLRQFKEEYRPFVKYSPKEMARRLIEFGKLHGITKEATRVLLKIINGDTTMSDEKDWNEGSNEESAEKPTAKKAGRPRKVGVIYTAKRAPLPDEKLSPQAEVILSTIAGAEGGKITRGDLLMHLSSTLETRQPPERVLAFYQPKLIASGLITVA